MTSITVGAADLTDLRALVDSSRTLIRSLQDASGAYPASPTFSAYRGYSWFRDGAFIADGMSAVGERDSADAFHDWCAGVLDARRERIADIVERAAAGDPVDDDAMLPTRFTFAGADGDDDWWDFQLDGYGIWLWSVFEHAKRHDIDAERWGAAVRLAADYLVSSWQRPCFDWWEEHAEHVHVSTLGCIVVGLERAAASGLLGTGADAARGAAAGARRLIAERGVTAGHLAKWLDDDAVDASLASLVAPLGFFDSPSAGADGAALAAGTVRAIDAALSHGVGAGEGVHRFAADTFFGGGVWPLLSAFVGLAEHTLGDPDAAFARLRWMAATVDDAGAMPEQTDDHLLAPERRQEWIDRWGTVAQPLLWSHAMFLRLAADLGVTEVRS